jgi:hypothetical protein
MQVLDPSGMDSGRISWRFTTDFAAVSESRYGFDSGARASPPSFQRRAGRRYPSSCIRTDISAYALQECHGGRPTRRETCG